MIYRWYYINEGPNSKKKASAQAYSAIIGIIICIILGWATVAGVLPDLPEMSIIIIGSIIGFIYLFIIMRVLDVLNKTNKNTSSANAQNLGNVDWNNISVEEFEQIIMKMPNLNKRSRMIRSDNNLNIVYFLEAVPLDVVTRPELAEILLKYGADINAEDSMGNTPLHNAANISMAKFLVEHGADYDKKNKFGETPIDLALKSKRLDVAEFLSNYQKQHL